MDLGSILAAVGGAGGALTAGIGWVKKKLPFKIGGLGEFAKLYKEFQQAMDAYNAARDPEGDGGAKITEKELLKIVDEVYDVYAAMEKLKK